MPGKGDRNQPPQSPGGRKDSGLELKTKIETRSTAKQPATYELYQYSEDKWQQSRYSELSECLNEIDSEGMCWINIEHVLDTQSIELLGSRFQLHEETLNAVLDPHDRSQRSRAEFYEDYYFIILYVILDNQCMRTGQVSIIMGRNFLITIQEQENNMYDKLRSRLHFNGTKIATMGIDYLAYSICDLLVDGFYHHIQDVFLEMADLEERISQQTEKNVAQQIHNIQRRLLHLDRLVWSIQETTDALQDSDNDLISAANSQFFTNCYEHSQHIGHYIDNYRDVARGILDFYLSINSNQMNQVIKILTIIATIFGPLTFIVGVYGMNFNPHAGPLSMPELNMPYGYMGVWAAMIGITVAMVWYFKKHKWL